MQLVLCLVILVGQRVLGVAADHRAVQTYENAEAIFEQVVDLQGHLDRHDRALSRGVSLLEWSPHPWIERHRVQPPPQAIDQAVTVNGRIAARLTKRLGTWWAFYLAAGTQVAWIVLAEAHVQRFDPYPFAFMSFLSTLAQLIFMIVIMVGQDVLGRAADRRSEQTFLDAKAILHECRRMKARLTTQDRILASLTSYVAVQVTEHLARAIHDDYSAIRESGAAAAADSPVPGRRRLARPLGRAARGVQGVQPRPGAADRREAGRHRLPDGAGLRSDPRFRLRRRRAATAGPARARALDGRAHRPGIRARARPARPGAPRPGALGTAVGRGPGDEHPGGAPHPGHARPGRLPGARNGAA